MRKNYVEMIFVLFINNVYRLLKAYLGFYFLIGVLYLFAINDIPPVFLIDFFTEFSFWNIINGLFLWWAFALLMLEGIRLYRCLKLYKSEDGITNE